MKKGISKTASRRTEMKVALGEKTIARFVAYYAEGDYSTIARLVKEPPTTHVTISKYLNEAKGDSKTAMPLSIAKAIQAFYIKKEKEAKSLLA